MDKISFKLYTEIVSNLLDGMMVRILNLKKTKWYREYIEHRKPRVSDLVSMKLLLYFQSLIVFLKKSILRILSLLPPHLSLRIIHLLIRIKNIKF